VKLGLSGQQDCKGIRALRALLEYRVIRALREKRVRRDLLAHRVMLVRPVMMVSPASRDLRVQREYKALLA